MTVWQTTVVICVRLVRWPQRCAIRLVRWRSCNWTLTPPSDQGKQKFEITEIISVAETGSSSTLDTRVAFLGPAVVYIFSLIQSDSLRSSVLHSTTNCLRAESEDCLPECAVHWSRGEGSDALGNCLELLPLGLSACKKGFS